MRGQPPYDVTELLCLKMPNITVPQLLNSAPALTRELAILLRSLQPLTRKCKTAPRFAHSSMVQITIMAEDDHGIEEPGKSTGKIVCKIGERKVIFFDLDAYTSFFITLVEAIYQFFFFTASFPPFLSLTQPRLYSNLARALLNIAKEAYLPRFTTRRRLVASVRLGNSLLNGVCVWSCIYYPATGGPKGHGSDGGLFDIS